MAIVATNENIHDKEVQSLKRKLKRTQILCKTIYKYYGHIYEIKEYLANEQNLGAQELWEELDYPVQSLLITAPLHGGVFTTNEVRIITGFWKVTIDDIEGSFDSGR